MHWEGWIQDLTVVPPMPTGSGLDCALLEFGRGHRGDRKWAAWEGAGSEVKGLAVATQSPVHSRALSETWCTSAAVPRSWGDGVS